MKTAVSILTPVFAYLVLCTGTYLMLRLILDYTSFETNIHFLEFKQDYIHIGIWRVAFYTHVFTSLFALAAGFTQFSSSILKRKKYLHRLVGKLYVGNILFINFPSALILAIYANGLWPSKLAFLILDCLWFYFTYRAYSAIRQGKVEEHKRFMIRSYALTFSAITLRTWKIVLFNAFHPDPLTLYMIEAWMGFFPNLLFAEWLLLRMRKKKRRRLPLPSEIHQNNKKNSYYQPES